MQVFSEGVVIVAGRGLAGLAETSAIISNDAVTSSQESWHLLFPGSAAQWVSVNKDNRLTRTVVLIVKVDVAGVFFTDINVWHRDSPSLLRVVGWLAYCSFRDRIGTIF